MLRFAVFRLHDSLLLIGTALAACSFLGRASCQSPPTWTRAGAVLDGRTPGLAFDSDRGRVVLFGGYGPACDETWEWDGTTWSYRRSATTPPARWEHAMAYDSARRRVVMFGGRADPLVLADTWEWDGVDWTLRTPATTPGPRFLHAMTYDSTRGRVVMFGGEPKGTTPNSETWEWDGLDWSLRSTGPAPRASFAHGLAFDSARSRTVLFGGSSATGYLGDTWEWDGTSWAQRSATGPGPRNFTSMAFDSNRMRTVLFGGQATAGVVLGDTWEWDGNAWSQITTGTSPAPQYLHPLAYDSARKVVVMTSGQPPSYSGRPQETWEWNGSSWLLKHTIAPFSGAFSLVMDLARGVVVGLRSSATIIETWEWDGITWTQRQPLVSPPTRNFSAACYDILRSRTVLFGGSLSARQNDTWEWDGTMWSQLSPATSPPPRAQHAMAYDLARGRTVLCGGNGVPKDVWEWDGTTWTQIPASSGPGDRYEVRMCYSPMQTRVLAYGGSTPAAYPSLPQSYGDLWSWDGGAWTLLSAPPAAPFFRGPPGIAYDSARQRLVLTGTIGAAGISDTWEWDGVSWKQTQTGGRGPWVGAMTYDPRFRACVKLSGIETWLYGNVPASGTTPLGNGCAGAAGVPLLTAGLPFLGNSAFTLDLQFARSTTACAFGLSATSQSLGLGSGCTLYLSAPIVLLPTTSSATGFAAVTIPIPGDLHLLGGTVHTQAFTLDAAAALGASMTGTVRLGLGF